MTAVSSLELEVTHRGLHRFIPRHKDEMNIGIGDPIHVIKECDDLWCEGMFVMASRNVTICGVKIYLYISLRNVTTFECACMYYVMS